MSELRKIIVNKPIDREPLVELLQKIMEEKPWPEWACGIVFFVYTHNRLCKPIIKSRRGKYYTKKRWRPLFGREIWHLGSILADIAVGCDHPYTLCEKVAVILNSGEIYIGCAFPSEEYIFVKLVCKVEIPGSK